MHPVIIMAIVALVVIAIGVIYWMVKWGDMNKHDV